MSSPLSRVRAEATPPGTGQSGALRRTWRRFARNRGALAGGAIVLLFLAIGLLSPWLAPYDPLQQHLEQALLGPSLAHPFGTDELGRDLLSRIIAGSQITLAMAASAVFSAVLLGAALGIVAGYFGGLVDTLVSRALDVLLSLPDLLLAIAIITVFGVGIQNVILSIAVASVPTFARLARASTLSLRELEYIQAARALGCPDHRIILRHILPNVIPPLIVQTTLRVATALLTASGLSFLGLGAQPPTPEWGAMLSTGRSYLTTRPHVAIVPGLAILLIVLGFNLLGDGLRDSLDVRLKH